MGPRCLLLVLVSRGLIYICSSFLFLILSVLGTSHTGGYSHSSVVYALKECGYRLIDTAKRYGTETFIHHAIVESGVAREQLFLTTKLWPTDFGHERTLEALKGSINRLGVDYLDLFLIHYPKVSAACAENKWQLLGETWRALELAYDQGDLVRAIGVSNYSVDDLERTAPYTSMMPLLNQIEFHPYQQPTELIDYCAENRIQIQGYCPLGSGNLVNSEPVVQIANACQRTAAQVLIRWSLQHQVPTIPKSTKRERVRENINVFDFELTEQQMDRLDRLAIESGNQIKFIELDIEEKIDENKPDGYKLDQSLKDNLFQS